MPPIKQGAKVAQEMAAQMRLLAARIADNQKIMDTIPEAFRGFLNPKGQSIKAALDADTKALAQLKARSMGARSALPLAAAGATAVGAELASPDEAEAGKINYLSEAFQQMFSASLKSLDDAKLLALAQKHENEADDLFKRITHETPHDRASRIKEGRERPGYSNAPEEIRNKYQESNEKRYLAGRELKNRGLDRPHPKQITEEEIRPIVEDEMGSIKRAVESKQKQTRTHAFLENHAKQQTNEQLLADYWRISDKDLYAGGKPLSESEFYQANVYGEELMRRGVDPADFPSKAWSEAKAKGRTAPPPKPQGPPQSAQAMPLGFGGDQEQDMPVNVNPPSNPTSGRLIDQLRGQPYRDRFSGGPPVGGNLMGGQEVTPELEEMRRRIIANWMRQYGGGELPTSGSPLPPVAGGGPGADGLGGPQPPDLPPGIMMGGGGTDASMGGGKVPFQFPPPPAGAIPQEEVEGFDRTAPSPFPAGDPRRSLDWMQPGLGQEVQDRYLGTAATLGGSPKQTAAAVGADFAADIVDVGKFIMPSFPEVEVQGKDGQPIKLGPEGAPLDFTRPMAERAIQRLIDQNPEQERTIRDAVEIMSISVPTSGYGSLTKKGIAAARSVRGAGKAAIGADATAAVRAVDPWATQAAQAVDPAVVLAGKLQKEAAAAAKLVKTMTNASPADMAVAQDAALQAAKAASEAAKAAKIPTVQQIVMSQRAAGGKLSYAEALDIRNAVLRGEIKLSEIGQTATNAQTIKAGAKQAVKTAAAANRANPSTWSAATRLPDPATGLAKAADTVGKVVGTLRNKFASLPGSRPDVARLFKDKAVKKALTKGLAGSQEAFHNMSESIRVGGVQKMRDVIENMQRVTKGDPKEMAKLGALLSRASAGKTPKAVDILLKGVDPDVRRTFDAALDYFDNQVGTLAKINGMSEKELALFKKQGGRDKLTFYDALRNPERIKQVRGTAAWDRLYELIERTTTKRGIIPTKGPSKGRWKQTVPRDQIIGEMEQLLKEEVVRSYQETGKLPTSFLNTNPNLRAVQGMKATDPLLREIFGEVRDFPTQFELGVRTLATRIAREHIGSKLIQDFHGLGLSSKIGSEGMLEVPAKFAPKGAGPTFMPAEIIDSLEFGEKAAEAVSKFGIASSAWRAGKTVGSPTSAGVTNFLSNLGDVVADGAGLDPDFWVTDLPDAIKAGTQVVGRGAAREAQAFERGLAKQGLGAGSVSGELSQHMKRGGLLSDNLSEGKRYEKAPRRLHGFTRGLERFFEQGDVIPKRAVAPRRVAQMNEAMSAAAPEELQAMQEIFGSTNPVTVVAERMRNHFQTYSRVPTGFKEFSKNHPVAGAFISFPVEMARNSGQHFNYLGKELKMAMRSTTPSVRSYWAKEAMKHATGMVVAYGVIPGVVKETMQAAYGYVMTDEQTEVLNERGVPEFDRGNVAVLDRDGDEVTYSPLGRLDYFNQLHKAANAALGLAASIYKGDTSRIDDGVIDLAMQTAGQLVPYQEPTGMLYEAATNKKLEGNVLESMLAGSRGYEQPPLSTATNELGRKAEWFTKSALPTALPTTLLQAGRLAGGASVSDVSPVGTTKKTNMAISMRREAAELANEKNNLYVARLGKLSRDKEMSVEAKRRAVDQMREDWNTGLGQRIFDTARAWDKVFPRSRVLTEMERVGQYHLGVVLNDGRVPLFDEVFSASIPPEVRRR